MSKQKYEPILRAIVEAARAAPEMTPIDLSERARHKVAGHSVGFVLRRAATVKVALEDSRHSAGSKQNVAETALDSKARGTSM